MSVEYMLFWCKLLPTNFFLHLAVQECGLNLLQQGNVSYRGLIIDSAFKVVTNIAPNHLEVTQNEIYKIIILIEMEVNCK